MRVWVWPERTYEEAGAERYEIAWEETKASATARIAANEARGVEDEYDPDVDVSFRYDYHPSLLFARKRARAVLRSKRPLAYGCVRITLQRVGLDGDESPYHEWLDVGEPEYVD